MVLSEKRLKSNIPLSFSALILSKSASWADLRRKPFFVWPWWCMIRVTISLKFLFLQQRWLSWQVEIWCLIASTELGSEFCLLWLSEKLANHLFLWLQILNALFLDWHVFLRTYLSSNKKHLLRPSVIIDVKCARPCVFFLLPLSGHLTLNTYIHKKVIT